MTRIITCVLLSAVALCATPVFAGPLTSVSGAYFDGFNTWQSTTGYSDGNTLFGTIDWAVFGPGDFPGGYSGFTPAPGDFVYAYQAYEDGSAPLSGLSVALEAGVSSIGTFSGDAGNGSVTGLAPFDSYFFPGGGPPYTSANWDWSPGIEATENSMGLVFSSPFGPKLLAGSVIDDGSVADVIPLPSPDPEYIPEPGTLTLACCGLAVFAFQWLRRRGRELSL